MVFCGKCKHFRCSFYDYGNRAEHCDANPERQEIKDYRETIVQYIHATPGKKNANNNCPDYEQSVFSRLFKR